MNWALEAKERVDHKIIKTATRLAHLAALHARPRPERTHSLPRPLRPQPPIQYRLTRAQSLPRPSGSHQSRVPGPTGFQSWPIRPPHPTVSPPDPPTFPVEEEEDYSQVGEVGSANSDEGEYLEMEGGINLSGGDPQANPEDDTLGGSKTDSEGDHGEASSKGPSPPKKDGKPVVPDEEEENAQGAFLQEMAQLWGWQEMTPEAREHLIYMNQIAIFEGIVGRRIPVAWIVVEALPPPEQEKVCQLWGLGSLQDLQKGGTGSIVKPDATPRRDDRPRQPIPAPRMDPHVPASTPIRQSGVPFQRSGALVSPIHPPGTQRDATFFPGGVGQAGNIKFNAHTMAYGDPTVNSTFQGAWDQYGDLKSQWYGI